MSLEILVIKMEICTPLLRNALLSSFYLGVCLTEQFALFQTWALIEDRETLQRLKDVIGDGIMIGLCIGAKTSMTIVTSDLWASGQEPLLGICLILLGISWVIITWQTMLKADIRTTGDPAKVARLMNVSWIKTVAILANFMILLQIIQC